MITSQVDRTHNYHHKAVGPEEGAGRGVYTYIHNDDRNTAGYHNSLYSY